MHSFDVVFPLSTISTCSPPLYLVSLRAPWPQSVVNGFKGELQRSNGSSNICKSLRCYTVTLQHETINVATLLFWSLDVVPLQPRHHQRFVSTVTSSQQANTARSAPPTSDLLEELASELPAGSSRRHFMTDCSLICHPSVIITSCAICNIQVSYG